jgi:transposase
VIESHLPLLADRGRERHARLRDVVDSIFYVAQSSCQWRLLPKEFPPYEGGMGARCHRRRLWPRRCSNAWRRVVSSPSTLSAPARMPFDQTDGRSRITPRT